MRAIVRPTNHLFVSIGPVGLVVLSPFVLLYLMLAFYAMVALGLFQLGRWLVWRMAHVLTFTWSFVQAYRAERRRLAA